MVQTCMKCFVKMGMESFFGKCGIVFTEEHDCLEEGKDEADIFKKSYCK